MEFQLIHVKYCLGVTDFVFGFIAGDWNDEVFFTRGQFWPSGIVVACVCVCLSVCLSVCLCVNHLLVRAITRDLFKLGSPNLDQRCKRPWLRSLLFSGPIDLDLQGQIKLKSQNLPHFELVRTITSYPFKLGSPNLDQRWKIAWWRSLLFWVAIDPDLQGQIWFKLWNFSTKLICAVFVNIYWDHRLYTFSETIGIRTHARHSTLCPGTGFQNIKTPGSSTETAGQNMGL